MDVEIGDQIRAIDQRGRHEPAAATVVHLTGWYIIVQYAPDAVKRLGLTSGYRDTYWRGSGWRAWDGELRWRLQEIRTCQWCEHDISGPGEAHPILYAGRGWKCANTGACIRRQDFLDAQSGMPPIAEAWRVPVAYLEAAR